MSDPYPAVDRDYASQNFQTAQTVLSEVGAGLAGAPPEVLAVHKAAQGGIAKAHSAIYGAQREIDRVINDHDLFPVGRFEKASAAYEKAEAVVKQELMRVDAAARTMGPMLESAAMPRLVGSDQEQQFVRDEIRDIVNRSSDPGQALAELARKPRYAAIITGDFGKSLLLGRGMDERTVDRTYDLVKAEAFAWTIANGTPEQRAAAARISAAETMKAAPMAAGEAFRMWLEEMAAKVHAARIAASRA
jgi:hypothetical protein